MSDTTSGTGARAPGAGRHTPGQATCEGPADTPRVEHVEVAVYHIPTDGPEADGTIAWASTTMVLVRVEAGGMTGLGYTYASAGAASVIRDVLTQAILGRSAAASFTSYTDRELVTQLAGWVEQGIPRVKMKIGADPGADVRRVRAARAAIGDDAELYVDANGVYAVPEARWFAERFAEPQVSWFEEPVSSDELEGLHELRGRVPAGMAVAAGEYGSDLFYFRRMLDAGAVHVLQADATRCGGISGFLRVAALCAAYGMELSAHTAPLIHLAPAAAVGPLRHVEYFHDHVRIERMLFDGVPKLVGGDLIPTWDRPGLGVEFKTPEAEPYRVA